MPSPRVPHAVAVLAAIASSSVAAHGLVAQRVQVRAEVPIAVQGKLLADPAKAGGRVTDPGPVVRLLESPNVDRFLRRAQDFIGRSDWPNAIRVIQDVIEGRTLEEATEREAAGREFTGTRPAGENPTTAASETAQSTGSSAHDPWRDAGESSTQSVFSADDRLYRPVQRLCHELLAAMPPEAVAWYRAQYAVHADRELDAARRARDVAALELVHDRWFLTRAANQALRTAGDLLMDQGRMRAAYQAYRRLLDVHQESARRDAGLDDLWLRTRAMLCLALLGERSSAGAVIDELREHHAMDSLRIQGELVPVAGLAESDAFRAVGVAHAAETARTRATAFRSPNERPVPLFEHRFTDPAPYRPGKGQDDQGQVVFIGNDNESPSATPRYGDFQPGTHACFLPGGAPDSATLAFFDHFRVTLVEASSGKLLASTTLDATVPGPAPGTPRVRIPAYDWNVLRVGADAERIYSVTGPSGRRLAGMKSVLRTTLEARRRSDLEPVWSTEASQELRDVTFLAAPTVEGSKLFVPAMHAGTYWLLALNANDGSILFRTPLHREGTELAKPPTVPVVVDAGSAYVLTNAGALASVDVLSGSIEWIRRYERSDPIRPPRRRPVADTQRQVAFGGQYFRELPLDGFAPSDLVVEGGLVVIAPSDGEELICVDGATGEPRWMCERRDMQYVIGAELGLLFLGGEDSVTAIGLASGVRLWRSSLPAFEGSTRWRGRGLVRDGRLLVPAERSVLVMPTDASQPWTSIPIPSFRLGRDPLGGATNLFAHGPWLAAAHAGGIEVFSTVDALFDVARQIDDPLRKAMVLAQAGELVAAVDAIENVAPSTDAGLLDEVGRRMVAWCGEIALAHATRGSRDKALEAMARARARMTSNRLVQRWHLVRIELFAALGDLDAVGAEQEALYALMETGG
ncbi:MAG: PQQ-binding-like beta-propeller repeat protein [Planctomycetes bacterium]|nr:PQQ-binding-like beta-propeller repeat protein [Planctomycetota bacterium]